MGRILLFSMFILFSSMVKASNLVPYIHTAAAHYHLKERDLMAILWLESSGGTNVQTNFNTNGTADFGPFQINSVHARTTCKEYNILTDYGNTMCAAKLLARHKKHAATDPMWQGRYHSRTPSLKRAYYARLVRASN